MKTSQIPGNEAIIVLLLGANPALDRFTMRNQHGRTTVVAVPDPPAAGPAASQLVADGAQRIELCGGLGPQTAGAVAGAVGARVPVGAVSFGLDSVDAAAAFRDRIVDAVPMKAGFVYLHQGLSPRADRRVLDIGPLRTVFVPVPRESDAAAAAAGLVDEGAELIELYRGIGTAAAGEVIEAVGGRAAVGAAR
jgi:Family of unknown function (DUF6506)